MHIRIILECFEKCKCPGIYFFLQSSKCVSNEQHCLKTAGLYDDLLRSLFHFFYISHSVLSFILCFPVSPTPFFLVVLSQAIIKHSRKAFVYIYIYIVCIVYFRKFMNFCLAKTIYDILIPLVLLSMNRMLDF